jgi:hypothetical protein
MRIAMKMTAQERRPMRIVTRKTTQEDCNENKAPEESQRLQSSRSHDEFEGPGGLQRDKPPKEPQQKGSPQTNAAERCPQKRAETKPPKNRRRRTRHCRRTQAENKAPPNSANLPGGRGTKGTSAVRMAACSRRSSWDWPRSSCRWREWRSASSAAAAAAARCSSSSRTRCASSRARTSACIPTPS